MEKKKIALDAVFERVKQIYKKYNKGSLTASTDNDTNYILTSPPVPQSKLNEVWFGGVQIKKNYVSCHLMPIYIFPDLLEDISPQLRKRMQGKSCFNFTRVDEGLLAEYEQLIQRGYQRFLDGGWMT